MEQNSDEDLLTIQQVANWLGLNRSTISHYIEQGRLEVIVLDPSNPHSHKRIRRGEVRRFLGQSKEA